MPGYAIQIGSDGSFVVDRTIGRRAVLRLSASQARAGAEAWALRTWVAATYSVVPTSSITGLASGAYAIQRVLSGTTTYLAQATNNLGQWALANSAQIIQTQQYVFELQAEVIADMLATATLQLNALAVLSNL